MTREEAANIIEDRVRVTEYVESNYVDCVDIESLKMAIEALRQPEQQWIPCSERIPEEDVEVLIAYRYKEGEGDTNHTDIDITTYGQMYFGGNKVGNYKHWRQPFEYFECNYEVVAWMPLPEPYEVEE